MIRPALFIRGETMLMTVGSRWQLWRADEAA